MVQVLVNYYTSQFALAIWAWGAKIALEMFFQMLFAHFTANPTYWSIISSPAMYFESLFLQYLLSRRRSKQAKQVPDEKDAFNYKNDTNNNISFHRFTLSKHIAMLIPLFVMIGSSIGTTFGSYMVHRVILVESTPVALFNTAASSANSLNITDYQQLHNDNDYSWISAFDEYNQINLDGTISGLISSSDSGPTNIQMDRYYSIVNGNRAIRFLTQNSLDSKLLQSFSIESGPKLICNSTVSNCSASSYFADMYPALYTNLTSSITPPNNGMAVLNSSLILKNWVTGDIRFITYVSYQDTLANMTSHISNDSNFKCYKYYKDSSEPTMSREDFNCSFNPVLSSTDKDSNIYVAVSSNYGVYYEISYDFATNSMLTFRTESFMLGSSNNIISIPFASSSSSFAEILAFSARSFDPRLLAFMNAVSGIKDTTNLSQTKTKIRYDISILLWALAGTLGVAVVLFISQNLDPACRTIITPIQMYLQVTYGCGVREPYDPLDYVSSKIKFQNSGGDMAVVAKW